MTDRFSTVISGARAEQLRAGMRADTSFREKERDYAAFCYEGPGVSVAYFPKHGKLVVQGKGTEQFVRQMLPEGWDAAQTEEGHILPAEQLTPHFGTDESGKGDYFGPLVVAGVYVNETVAPQLARLGCKDSKQMSSDEQIARVAAQVKELPGIAYEVLCIGPARYNELYAQLGNLNTLLAWGHARVIAALHTKVPSCPRALSDQFAGEGVLRHALGDRGMPVVLEQRPRAESDLAVAAASILARARFVEWMRQTSHAAHCQLPLGCAPHVLTAACSFVAQHGFSRLRDVAKLHFKLTKELERSRPSQENF